MIIERAMPLGGSVTIDGEDVTDELDLKSDMMPERTTIPPIPAQVLQRGVVYLNGEYYAVCKGNSTNYLYKYDGEAWTCIYEGYIPVKSVTNANSNVYPVVFNDEIYYYVEYGNPHLYKFDGEAWTSITSLYNVANPYMFVINNELHIITGLVSNNSPYSYKYVKWDGKSLTEVYRFYIDTSNKHAIYPFIYNDYVYYYDAYSNKIYYIDEGSSKTDSDIDISFLEDTNGIIAHENKIHSIKNISYKLNNVTYYKSAVCIYDVTNNVYNENVSTKYLSEAGSKCTHIFDVDGKIHILKGNNIVKVNKMYYNEKE